MKKLLLSLLCIILFIGVCNSQILKSNKDSKTINQLNYVKFNLQNSIIFLNKLDSNTKVKEEYLLGLQHYEKAKGHLGRALLGLVSSSVLAAIAVNNENEVLGFTAVGGLVYTLYYDISSLVHSLKALKHFKKAYKLAGMIPPDEKGVHIEKT
jgi:hypothetical protein